VLGWSDVAIGAFMGGHTIIYGVLEGLTSSLTRTADPGLARQMIATAAGATDALTHGGRRTGTRHAKLWVEWLWVEWKDLGEGSACSPCSLHSELGAPFLEQLPRHEVGQVVHALGVAELVVVPGEDLDEALVDNLG
jgi:hypothetical protein